MVAVAVSVGALSVGVAVPDATAAKKRTTTRKAPAKKPRTTVPPSRVPASTISIATTSIAATSIATLPPSTGLPIELPSLSVATRTATFVDSSRQTAATTASPVKSSRTLVTLIVAPTDTARRYPLFVFGHGLGGRPAQYEQLLRRIASTGFVVAAPTFPLSNTDAPGGPSLFDQPNQPADMSFAITQMLSDPQVDPDRVFVGGHSLGGITTVDLIGNASMVDRRVDAAIVVAGTANLFGASKLFQNTPSTPVLFLHGDADATVPIALGFSTYLAALTPKWFVTVLGGNHVFGIDRRPDLALESGLLYTDTMSVFLTLIARSQNAKSPTGATDNDTRATVTSALRSMVAVHSGRLTLQSAT